jgi:hypothetical protein
MPQGILPYKYEEEKTGSGMTALGGLPTYLDLAHAECVNSFETPLVRN